MAGYQTQIEKLLAEKATLQEQIAKYEKETSQREYRQGLKELPFWIRKPSVWFSIAEAEFKVAGVVDDITKYNYVLSQLDEEVTDNVMDVIKNPPIRGKYLKIKQELIRRLSIPEQERIRKLFDDELGDRTPSQFYRHLQCLAGAAVTVDKIILHLWLRRLPRHCQEILASRPEQTNLKLAELADNILEATKVSGNSTSAKNSLVDNIQQSVDELGKQVVALEDSVKRRGSPSRSRSTSIPHSQNTTPAPKTCWYHTQWGSEAYRCIPPCNWKKPEDKEN